MPHQGMQLSRSVESPAHKLLIVTNKGRYCCTAVEGLPHQGLCYVAAEAMACLPVAVPPFVLTLLIERVY